MKQTKKIIAALAAATMVASCAGVVASADEAVRILQHCSRNIHRR